MDPVSLGLGVVPAVMQAYGAVESAYDLYLSIKDFPDTYCNIRVALLIERYRLELFKDEVLSIPDEEIQRIQNSSRDLAFWKILSVIFQKILNTFNHSSEMMEQVGGKIGLPEQKGAADWELIDNLSMSVKSPPKHSFSRIGQTLKFLLRDKSKMEQTIKDLKHWNDSLDSITGRLTQESCRRKLRTRLSTNNTGQLENVAAAAKFLEHWDIERMATARSLIENTAQIEEVEFATTARKQRLPPIATEYEYEMKQFRFPENPFPSDRVRATAYFQGRRVIIDWRFCEDDSWRIDNPRAFSKRTEALTKILNSDLRPLNLSILPSLGYFNQSKNITGYAFYPPEDAGPKDKPKMLLDAIKDTNHPDKVPDLGDRFDLAKALATTIFEIHNLGWVHKNVQSTNVLFWPKPDSSPDDLRINRPYLMGFDISRPNDPKEITEKPPFRPEDAIYRHPDYKDRNALAFQPSYDIYSLGVLLLEIGAWKKMGSGRPRSSVGSREHPDSRMPQSPPPSREQQLPAQFNSSFTTARDESQAMLDAEISKLKRLMGSRYRDAVAACFSPDLDAIWKDQHSELDREAKLHKHLDLVRQKVVDVLALCSA